MRRLVTVVAAVTVVVAAAPAQEAGPAAARYGVEANAATFPQTTPQAALASVVRAAERGRYEYLVAQLLDPAGVDARIEERSRYLVDAVDRELRGRSAEERVRPPAGARLPTDPAAFAEVVRAEARLRAFREVAREVPRMLAENPDHLRDLRRFARSGLFAEGGDAAGTMTLPELKERAVQFVRVGDRWFVKDAQRPPAGK